VEKNEALLDHDDIGLAVNDIVTSNTLNFALQLACPLIIDSTVNTLILSHHFYSRPILKYLFATVLDHTKVLISHSY